MIQGYYGQDGIIKVASYSQCEPSAGINKQYPS